MAVCKQTSQEFIQDVFSPMVAVLCSQDAENICRKNNLTFVELVQPFCRINTEVTIRDPSNISITMRNLHIVVKDMKYQPPPPALAKKMMNDAVSCSYTLAPDGVLCNRLNSGNYSLKYFSSTPWFEAYRDVFFQVTYPTEHEFIHHFLACVFVISSGQPDPFGKINELHQQQEQYQQQSSSHGSHWFFPSVLKYYVLLHDVSEENLSKAEIVYQNLKTAYGAGVCHLLQINSSPVNVEGNSVEENEDYDVINLPDPWSQFLPKTFEQTTLVDNEANKLFPDETNFQFPEHIYEGNQEETDGIVENDTVIQHPLSLNVEQESPTVDSVTSSPLVENVTPPKVYGQNGTKRAKENKHHGMHLTLSDRERIRVFIQDFCAQGLVPFIEKQIRILSDQVANRKGLHRSLFSATKKWFSGNKPGMQGPASSTTSVVYGQDAPELQVRRLGDLAFMFQLYDLAYQSYHNAKRDFSSDQAWLYYAGATEMAALSVFMQGSSSQRQFPPHYMDSAITTYLNTCKSPLLATRATLLSTECLKSKGMYSDAALHFIRMTSEESDLRSALLLEQAAHCFINKQPPMIRKYAFHVILAGHRFSKAGQRKHALRAYKLAEQVYKEKYWRLADDHINYIIGRQSLNLKQLEDACGAFQQLLTEHSLQPAAQQGTFLREYLFVLKLLKQNIQSKDQILPILPLPLIDAQNIKILLGQLEETTLENNVVSCGISFEKADHNTSRWIHLEELAITAAHGSLPITHHPQLQCLSRNTDNSTRPLSVVGEFLTLEMNLRNPFHAPLILTNIFLLWSFIPKEDGRTDTILINEVPGSKQTATSPVVKVLQEVKLEEQEAKKIHLCIQPLATGDLHITGIAYTLQTACSPNRNIINSELSSQDNSGPKSFGISNISVQGKQNLELVGRRLNNTKAEKAGKVYGPDYRLKPVIVNPMPKLQVKFYNFSSVLFCGEVRQMTVQFSNAGQRPIHRILVVSPNPESYTFGTLGHDLDGWMAYKETCTDHKPSPVLAECADIDPVCEIFSLEGGPCQLQCGETISVPMWIRGPDTPGDHTIDFLFYYEENEPLSKMRYRLLQHSTTITTYPSLKLNGEAMRSCAFSEDPFNQCKSSANCFVISLQVENIGEGDGTEISILQVSCISRDWCLYPLSEVQGQGAVCIRQKEALLLTLKAVPFNTRNTVSSHKVAISSQVPLGRTVVDSSTTPCCDFSWRSHLRISDQTTLLNKSPVNLQHHPVENAEPLQALNLTLTVLWKAKVERANQTQIVVGQHHANIEHFGSTTSPLPETDILKQQINSVIYEEKEEVVKEIADFKLTDRAVKCTISHPFHVHHNFLEKRLVEIPVILGIHNCYQRDIFVTVNMQEECKSTIVSSISTPFSQQEFSHVLESGGFTWVGPSQRQVYLKAESIVQLSLQACFLSPGTYMLGNMIQVSCGLSKTGAKVLQKCMPPCLTIVSNDK